MNFALILFLFVVLTGILWVFNHFWAKKNRPAHAKDPWWVEYGASFFPVILSVFVLRSFVVEPFKIPSGSMIPTLLVGDFILVNKFTYGIRLPVINKKIVELNRPQRGDVVVFRYPPNPSLDYIKRVVGLPGDTVEYRGKQLIVNGQVIKHESAGDYLDPAHLYYTPKFNESLGAVQHAILIDPDTMNASRPIVSYPHADKCHYNHEGITCQVPAGHYFVMGDNRDNSQYSRYWGFLPDTNLVGKAFFIWFNFSDLKRIGAFH
jgi:signal peptidase I